MIVGLIIHAGIQYSGKHALSGRVVGVSGKCRVNLCTEHGKWVRSTYSDAHSGEYSFSRIANIPYLVYPLDPTKTRHGLVTHNPSLKDMRFNIPYTPVDLLIRGDSGMTAIYIKQGSLSALNSAAVASELHIAEPYFVSDINTLAVGTSASEYALMRAVSANVILVDDDYTVGLFDDLITGNAVSGDITLTLPSASSSTGRQFTIKKIDATSNYVIVSSVDNIDGASVYNITAQWEVVTVASDGTTYIKI